MDHIIEKTYSEKVTNINVQGLEEKERATAERKAQLKAAVEEGKRIPTELKKDAIALQKQIDLDGKTNRMHI